MLRTLSKPKIYDVDFNPVASFASPAKRMITADPLTISEEEDVRRGHFHPSPSKNEPTNRNFEKSQATNLDQYRVSRVKIWVTNTRTVAKLRRLGGPEERSLIVAERSAFSGSHHM